MSPEEIRRVIEANKKKLARGPCPDCGFFEFHGKECKRKGQPVLILIQGGLR